MPDDECPCCRATATLIERLPDGRLFCQCCAVLLTRTVTGRLVRWVRVTDVNGAVMTDP